MPKPAPPADPSREYNVNVRLPGALLVRLETLRPVLERDPRYAAARLDRTGLIRAALGEGISALERRAARADRGSPNGDE